MKSMTLLAALLLALSAGAETIDDPWSLVPPLPTDCYSKQDDFADKVAAAMAALDEAIGTQTAMNDEVRSQAGDMAQVDPFAMAQRMQEYMMNNPEEGMKMLQGMQMTGESSTENILEESGRVQELTASIDDLIKRYRTEYAGMRAPIDELVTENLEKADYWTDEVVAKLPVMSQQANHAYEQLCAKWWKSGPFDTPLADWRAFRTDETVPRAEQGFEQLRQQYDIQGIDTSEYRSTDAMEAAREYLKQLQRIFAERQPRKSNFQIDGTGFMEFPDVTH